MSFLTTSREGPAEQKPPKVTAASLPQGHKLQSQTGSEWGRKILSAAPWAGTPERGVGAC